MNRCFIGILTLIVLGAIIGVTTYFVTKDKQDGSSTEDSLTSQEEGVPSDPTTQSEPALESEPTGSEQSTSFSPTLSGDILPYPSSPPSFSLSDHLMSLLIPISGESSLADSTSPQSASFNWLMEDLTGSNITFVGSGFTDDDKEHVTARYVTALLYFSLGGESWKWQGFLSDKDICDWNTEAMANGDDADYGDMGIYCEDGVIKEIILGDNSLSNTIPFEISELSSLEVIELNDNDITGVIPPTLALLGNLTTLELYANKISGNVPPELADLASLRFLELHENKLTGTVPSELGNMTDLYRLYLHKNNLTGPITFCDKLSFFIRVDCLGPDPMIECECCIYCCDRDGLCQYG